MDLAPAHEAPKVRSQHVRILNEHWPLCDAKRFHARGIPERSRRSEQVRN